MVYALQSLSDGRLLVGGYFSITNSSQLIGITCLDTNGSLVPSFFCGLPLAVYTIATQADGKILIGGAPGYPATVNLVRLNADGSLDSSFAGGQGVAANGGNHRIWTLAVQDDGKILAGGEFYSINGVNQTNLARLNTDGSVDIDFKPRLGNQPANTRIFCVAIQPDHRILIAGYFTSVNGALQTNLARLNQSGGIDPAFRPRTDAQPDIGLYLMLQPDGRIVISGSFQHVNNVARNSIARLQADGSLDLSFSPDPAVQFEPWFPPGPVLQENGRLWLPGMLTHGFLQNTFAGLNETGAVESDSIITVGGSGFFPIAGAVAPQADGKIVVAGWFVTVNGAPRANIARMMGDHAPLRIVKDPVSTTAEIGTEASFAVTAAGYPAPSYQWFREGGAALPGTGSVLRLTDIQPGDAGSFVVVVTNRLSALTSAPAMLGVVPAVPKRWVPGITLNAQPGISCTLESAPQLVPNAVWTQLQPFIFSQATTRYFDVSNAIGAQRFYRASQSSGRVTLDGNLARALTLSGTIGSTVRIDTINIPGPTDAWSVFDLVPLTNSSQTYFDLTAFRSPPRLYRVTQLP